MDAAAMRKPMRARHSGLASMEIADRTHRLANIISSGAIQCGHAFTKTNEYNCCDVGRSFHNMAAVRKAPIHADPTPKVTMCHCLIRRLSLMRLAQTNTVSR